MVQFVLFYHTMHSFLADLMYEHFDLSTHGINNKISARFYANYPDVLKKLPKYAFTRTWHYTDIPEDEYCDKPDGILKYLEDKKNIGLLKGKDYFSETKSDNTTRDFGFLMHFLADAVEPFHSNSYGRGGLDIKGEITFDSENEDTSSTKSTQKVTLHQLFDEIFPNYYLEHRNKEHKHEDFKEISMEEVMKKSFLTACQFRLEQNFFIEVPLFFKDRDLFRIFDEMLVDYLNMAKKYVDARVK